MWTWHLGQLSPQAFADLKVVAERLGKWTELLADSLSGETDQCPPRMEGSQNSTPKTYAPGIRVNLKYTSPLGASNFQNPCFH